MFTVYNDGNVLSIDSTYSNLALYAKLHTSQLNNEGDCGYSRPTTNTNITYNELRNVPNKLVVKYTYQIPPNITKPIAAIGGLSDNFFAGGVRKNTNGNYVLEVYTESTNFNIYIFSDTKINQVRYGLEIFSPAGQVVFDSENKYLRILPQIRSDRTCALLLYGAVASEEVMQGTASYIYFMWCFYVNSSGAIVNAKNYQGYFSAHWGGISNNLPKPNYSRDPLIIDVTNY